MDNITKDFFISIGINYGMMVLDIGCGNGTTTELIAEMVGKNGKVIGVDSNQYAIAAATLNAQGKNINNIEYICSDLNSLSFEENKFDAILGRRILMYLPNPKATINKLSLFLKPNGLLGFQEHDSSSFIDKEKMPLHYKVNRWVWQLVGSNGGNINIGKSIWDIFSNKFISTINIKSEAIVQTPTNDISLTPIIHNLSNFLIAKSIISKQDILEGDLFKKLESEKRESEGIFIRELIFFVSAKKVA